VRRVALFAAGLAGVFLLALAAGRALDLDPRAVDAAHEEETMTTATHHTTTESHGAGHGGGHAAAEPAGLAAEQDGYRLEQDRSTFTAGRTEPYAFRIVGPDGETVRDFEVEHERRLHLIVAARSPGRSFLHLHPEQREDGSWGTPLRLPANGAYRVFADFVVDGERRTLGVDVAGSGGPESAADATTPYEVELHRAGDRLHFTVAEGGAPVALEPYLGALGHLVVLREGDLAYVHAHADEDELAFDVPFADAATYRLYLQFQVDGRVETARFELEA
jgi:hypothetical protein